MLASGQTVETINQWVEAGYTPDEVRAAVSQMQAKNLAIARPSSITNGLAIVRSKNKAPRKKSANNESYYADHGGVRYHYKGETLIKTEPIPTGASA
jgi:hypothetical protein